MDSEACIERLKKIQGSTLYDDLDFSQWFHIKGAGIEIRVLKNRYRLTKIVDPNNFSIFQDQYAYEGLEDIFLDPTNPTPPELTLFELEYGVEYPLLRYLKEIEDGKCS